MTDDPVYDAVGAVPHPETHADLCKQVVRYHTLRLQLEEEARCSRESSGSS